MGLVNKTLGNPFYLKWMDVWQIYSLCDIKWMDYRLKSGRHKLDSW
ncbi:hypothetical protein SAMN05421636_101488 [Pricia antarctica]|uniref:Uncharacterized protein n=1 Tax=Pricia antarctica TaxID=641691 RepID=A0A1G6X003_9FLAO|nr:hypothetical protein SAMN05421636_101488 [Pricia antarctica]